MYANPTDYVPQTGSLRRPLLMWLVVVAGSIGLLAMIVGAPLALSTGHTFWGLTIYRSFSYVCHQLPERSFFFAGHPLGVCSRCTGLYGGFAAATLLYPLVRSLRRTDAPERKWLFLAAAPLAIDFSLTFVGIWENTHSSRFVTGALLGAVSVFYVMPGLMDLSLKNWGQEQQHSASISTTKTSTAQVFSPNAPSDYSAPHRRI